MVINGMIERVPNNRLNMEEVIKQLNNEARINICHYYVVTS